ncbi:MAG: hypothetical protein BWY93_02270 [Euryarchaeota archaeon ADurb.BinA087]|nr:MAG: hypothetical protein BWY93_02270 [Euryarchaeota archaeon ADurb.BinA087]
MQRGIDRGILVGRQAGHRTILNDDIAELRDRYPERFPIALAGINGADVDAGGQGDRADARGDAVPGDRGRSRVVGSGPVC